MKHSLNIEYGKPDKNGREKIYIRVVINRTLHRISTDVYTDKSHKLTKDKKFVVDNKKNEIESNILNAQKHNILITKEVLQGNTITKDKNIIDYIDTLTERLKGRLSPGRLKHYSVLQGKLEIFKPDAKLNEINVAFLEGFESHLVQNGLLPNTIASNMSIFRAVMKRAVEDELMLEKKISGYKFPTEKETIPVYLNQSELLQFETHVFGLGDTSKKIAGMYFLLACYAGYRISDLYLFNYDKMIEDNRIVIRADKNGNIISMPVHSKLKTVVEYIKDKPIGLSEKEFRLKIKHIAADLNIKKTVKIHSGRHTFAMFLMAKGFTVDEVAKYLGDSVNVARVYAKISPKTLDDKILKAFNE